MINYNFVNDSRLFIKNGGDDIYNIACRDGGLCIDGGAAAGHVTKILLEGCNTKVIAFEPFPGNIPFFKQNVGSNPRVTFFQKALGRKNSTENFFVRKVVDGNQAGWTEMAGYSSEGYIVSDGLKPKTGSLFEVDVVRLDDVFSGQVTLLKLDLQGGEFDALVGCGDKLKDVKYCYVEFSLDFRTLDYFFENDFVVFDTPFTGIPKVPIALLDGVMANQRILNLSNGSHAVTGDLLGLPRDSKNYRIALEEIKAKYFHHLWSDLIAVNRRDLRQFFNSAFC